MRRSQSQGGTLLQNKLRIRYPGAHCLSPSLLCFRVGHAVKIGLRISPYDASVKNVAAGATAAAGVAVEHFCGGVVCGLHPRQQVRDDHKLDSA
jgi:hypothetical protein